MASKTLTDPWRGTIEAAPGDVAEAVAALKREEGRLLVIGSTELVKTLIDHGLVDEFRLMIDPVVFGGGKRLFATTARSDRCDYRQPSGNHRRDPRDVRICLSPFRTPAGQCRSAAGS